MTTKTRCSSESGLSRRGPPLRTPSIAVPVLYLSALAHLIVWAVCLAFPAGHVGDFQRYWQIATAAGRPYVDLPIEYPPGAVLSFGALAALTGGFGGFTAALLLLNLAADALVAAVLVDVWGVAAGAVYLAISAPLVSLLFFRFDLWSVAVATGAMACWTRGRRTESLVLLAGGTALKVWPLALSAWLLTLPMPMSRRVRWWPWLMLACLGAGVAWRAGAAMPGLLSVLTFRGATGWGIESTVGSVWRLLSPESIRLEAGAVRVGTIVPVTSIALFLITLPLACWAIYRGTAAHRSGLGWITGIGAILSCSALLSPQFLAWLLPGAAIAWAEGDRRVARWLAALIGVTVLYRVLHTTEMPGLVLMRNVLLIAMVSDGIWRLRRGLLAEPDEHGPVLRLQPADPPAA